MSVLCLLQDQKHIGVLHRLMGYLHQSMIIDWIFPGMKARYCSVNWDGLWDDWSDDGLNAHGTKNIHEYSSVDEEVAPLAI